jgi:hypothetical protein
MDKALVNYSPLVSEGVRIYQEYAKKGTFIKKLIIQLQQCWMAYSFGNLLKIT